MKRKRLDNEIKRLNRKGKRRDSKMKRLNRKGKRLDRKVKRDRIERQRGWIVK